MLRHRDAPRCIGGRRVSPRVRPFPIDELACVLRVENLVAYRRKAGPSLVCDAYAFEDADHHVSDGSSTTGLLLDRRWPVRRLLLERRWPIQKADSRAAVLGDNVRRLYGLS